MGFTCAALHPLLRKGLYVLFAPEIQDPAQSHTYLRGK